MSSIQISRTFESVHKNSDQVYVWCS